MSAVIITAHGSLHITESTEDLLACRQRFGRRIGTEVFHGHIAALSIARIRNQNVGAKVYRVIYSEGHFIVTRVSELRSS